MKFGDISKFADVNGYLPILNGVLLVETCTISLGSENMLGSRYLMEWYKKFGLVAVMTNVGIVTIILVFTRFIYGYVFNTFSVWRFAGLAVMFQIIHDLLFHTFIFYAPSKRSAVVDHFKGYVKEMGALILFGDAVVVFSSCIAASLFMVSSLNINIINLILTLYMIPYILLKSD